MKTLLLFFLLVGALFCGVFALAFAVGLMMTLVGIVKWIWNEVKPTPRKGENDR